MSLLITGVFRELERIQVFKWPTLGTERVSQKSGSQRRGQRNMSVTRKVNLKETQSKSIDTARHSYIKRESTVSSRISDQIGVTCSKLRSCSLGQKGMSASLLDLQNKSFNINGLVTNSVNIVKGISSSGEMISDHLTRNSF